MAHRFLELKQIAQIRKLDRNEQFEFDALQRARNAAAQDPALCQAKAEAARQQAELEQRNAAANTERAFQTVFSTVVPGKPPVQAIDNEANRGEIISWLHPGEVVPAGDVRSWFLKVLQETPSLKTRLAWQEHLTPAQKILQQKEDQKTLRERFDLACKTHGLDPSTANFNLWSSVSDPVVTWFNSKPIILREDGSELELIPATEAQKQEWLEQAQNKAFQERQQKLRELSAKGDIAGLRREAALEHAENHTPQAVSDVVQQRVYKELQTQYQRDTQFGFRDPLPAVFTKQKIYTWDAAEMRKQISRYGASRITARIHGLTQIPDGNGGWIQFE